MKINVARVERSEAPGDDNPALTSDFADSEFRLPLFWASADVVARLIRVTGRAG